MTYDPNGNTLNDGFNSYVWDARNRLVSADNNGASFSYDPLGRRVGKQILSSSTNFLYDGVSQVQELNGTTPTANLLTGGGDERFTRTDASGTYNYLTDALGSTVELTDPTGAMAEQYSYAPFGSLSASGAATTNSYTYTGRESDGLGIYYYRARYYNPNTGRFLSEDPLGFDTGVNFYAYVWDNPITMADPLGMEGTNPNGPNYSYIANMNDPVLQRLTQPPYGNGTKYYGESHQCVSATKHFSNAPCSDCWRPGPPVLGNQTLAPGTAIGTFDASGHFLGNSGVYYGQGQSPNSVDILDQWPGHPENLRELDPRNGDPSNDSNSYRVITVPPGTVSSQCVCGS